MTTSDPKRPDSAEPAASTEPSLADRIEELAARVEREAAAGSYGGAGGTGGPGPGIPATPGVPGSVGSGASTVVNGADVLASLLTEMRQDVSELRGVLEARMAVLEDSLDGVADRLEALARDGASTTGESLTGLATDVRALDARLAGIGGLPAVTATDLARISGDAAGQDSLADAVSDALNDLADAVGESLTALGATMAGSVEETKALVASTAESGSAAADAASAAAEAASAAAEAASVAAEAAASAAEGATAALRERPVQALAADLRPASPPGPTAASLINAAVADIRAGHGEDLTALRSDLADALDEVLDRVNLAAEDSSQRLIAAAEVSTAEHEELVFRADGASRAAAAEAEVLLTEITRNGGLLATIQADVQAQRVLSVSMVEEAKTAVARVDETLSGVAGALVRYLAERDRLVEAERIELLREVFTELATSMTPANRRKLASRVSDALNRRHDARDAERWREQGPKAAAPAPVEIQDVEELGALLDRHSDPGSDKGAAGSPDDGVPVRPATRASSGAAATVLAPVKVAPAKVAPAKVAPAKVAPANVAPDKMAPDKVAPAKVAPVKVASSPTRTRVAKAPAPAKGPAKAAPKANGDNAAVPLATKSPATKGRKAPGKAAPVTAPTAPAAPEPAVNATSTRPSPASPTALGADTGGSAPDARSAAPGSADRFQDS